MQVFWLDAADVLENVDETFWGICVQHFADGVVITALLAYTTTVISRV